MRIHLLAPVYTREVTVVDQRKKRFESWLTGTAFPFGDQHGWTIDYLLGWPGEDARTRAIERHANHSLAGTAVYDSSDLVPKGKWVLQCLSNVLEKQSNANYSDHDVIILIDGSGKIDFSGALTIAERLAIGDKIILGRRSDPAKTMAEHRVRIERFENFLVSEKYHVELPDAQCGCWGFQGELLKAFPLLAQSYAIELDILIAALAAGCEPRFIDVQLTEILDSSGVKQTDYRPEQDITKLTFLLYRLDIDPELIEHYIGRFEKETKLELPENYKNQALALKSGEARPKLKPVNVSPGSTEGESP